MKEGVAVCGVRQRPPFFDMIALALSISVAIGLLALTKEHSDVLMTAIAAIPATVGAYAALVAAKHAKRASKNSEEVNDSVNHRHEKGGMRVYDLSVSNYRLMVQMRRMTAAIIQHLRDNSVGDTSKLDELEREHPSTQSIVIDKDLDSDPPTK